MPPLRVANSPSPLSSITPGSTKGGSGLHRGTHDGQLFPHHPSSGSILAVEASLASQDFIRELLRLAQGDLSAVTALTTTADTTSTQTSDVLNSHTAAAGLRAANTSLSDASGGGSSNIEEVLKRDVQMRMLRSVKDGGGAMLLTSHGAARPVPVLRHSDDSTHQQQRSLGGVDRSSMKALPTDAENTISLNPSCISTDAEACSFYLTALVANALHMEDYWIHLAHQIEVDQYVEFIQFCAEANFGALKTMHLLQWWKQYRAMVRDVKATHKIQLSDGNPQAMRSSQSCASELTGAAPATGGSGEGNTAAAAGKEATIGNTKASSKKSFRGGTPASVTSAAVLSDVDAITAADVPFSSLTTAYSTHEEAVRTELQRFVQWELEHEYEWRLVPREPFFTTTPGLLSPSGNNRGGSSFPATVSGGAAPPAGATPSSSSQGPAGKPSKADKAKIQLQHQQEMELEEQRLARIAALPPENIFLTKAEVDNFVRVVVVEDLMLHAALHAYVATQDGQPTCAVAQAAAPPVCFSVQVETPMPVLSLKDATRLGSQSTLVAPPLGVQISGDMAAADGHNSGCSNTTASQRSPPVPANTAQSKPRSRGSSKNAAANNANTNTSASATTTTAGATDATDELAAAQQHIKPPVLSAMEAFRAEQAKEAAAYREAYSNALAHAAAEERQAQHAADVNLFFEKSSTKTAVQAVYESMEMTVAARQQRILQRVTALEQALGLTETTGEGGAAANAGGSK